MRVVSLCSGSSGNAYLVQAGNHAVLIDCGKPASLIERYVRAHGVDPAQLDAIFITHDHSDHMRGAGTLSKRYGIPIVANQATLDACRAAWGRTDATAETGISAPARPTTRKEPVFAPMPTGGVKSIGGLDVHSFPVSHDAAEPVGYTFVADGIQGTLITDSGIATPQMFAPLVDSHLIIIEANHDQKMVVAGRYPWPLKQRILGDHGHLSNVQTAEILAKVLAQRSLIPAVWLIHLSQENNTPSQATGEIVTHLKMAADGLPPMVRGLRLQPAKRDLPSLSWRPETNYVQPSLF